MYKLNKSQSEFDIMTAIEGNDIYNSKFIYDLDRTQSAGTYNPTLFKGRLDLVASDLYSSDDPVFYETLAVYNRAFQEDNTKYKDLKYITKADLRQLKIG